MAVKSFIRGDFRTLIIDNDYETMTDDEFLNNLTSSEAEEETGWDNV